jgi:long-chain fatty acid transport protein
MSRCGGDTRPRQSLLLFGFMLAIPTAGANAAGFQLREGDPDWVANAFAGTAAKAYDAGTVWSNPAGMTFVTLPNGTAELDTALDLIIPSIHFSGQNFVGSTPVSGGNGGNAGPPAVTPGFEGMWSYSDKLRFGIATEAPFGLSTSYSQNFVGRYQAMVSSITDIELLLAASYQITNQFSIGGGPVIDYYHTRLTSSINIGRAAALTGDPAADISGDAVSAGYHIGAIYQVDDKFRIGIDYRSRIGVAVSGKQQIFVPPLLQQLSPPTAAFLAASNANVSTHTTVPDVLTLSTYYEITSEWAAMTTLQWTHWGLLQEVTIVADNGQVQRLNLGFRSSWFGSVGVNYKPVWMQHLMLQAGTGFDESPITDPVRSPRLPDSGRIPISIGATYDIVPRAFSVQVAYLHEFAVGSTATDYSATPAAGVLIGKYASSVNVFSVGTKLRF